MGEALYSFEAISATPEVIEACVIARDSELTEAVRFNIAQCLGWVPSQGIPLCAGQYQPINITPLASAEEIRIVADSVRFSKDKPSVLKGHVQLQQDQKIVEAQTAYVYRNPKTNKVERVEFLGYVRYSEPGRLMIARKAVINPQDNSGQTEDVLYRFDTQGKRAAKLPAWGRANLIQRFANKNYLLKDATYTNCAPHDKAWDISAKSIVIDDAKAKGVAKNALVRIRKWPVLYTPYLSFPTNNERKSGFLLPEVGYSNVGGMDISVPYYWNIAPNYDLTLEPHLYSERGVMFGGEFRYLTPTSRGILNASALPDDRAFSNFLQQNQAQFPRLAGNSTDRWSIDFIETTQFNPQLQLNINLHQVSDDYYLQDFSSNLAVITQRQLLSQADITYSTNNWVFRGMGQSYQTLHPVNESPIDNIYERLPQLMAHGFYYELPWQAHFSVLGQYDQFHWSNHFWDNPLSSMPYGPRVHINPILSFPQLKTWGFITPELQVVENYYKVQNTQGNSDFNRTIPRFSVDSGLFFERQLSLLGAPLTQTLEPRLYYLNVPYQNQTSIPVYDSGFMIFNVDQLFRDNRYSGFDRIGDANQLTYALTSRWLSRQTGVERAVFSLGQIRYFSNRKVPLCQSITGTCVEKPDTFGYLSPISDYSPVASRAVYRFNSVWGVTGDYIWDPYTRATNNADLNLHYQPEINKIINVGYSYLVNGDITMVRGNKSRNDALHQALVSLNWPISDRWSAVGAYSQNISKNYSMMSLVGLQYDSCCWAIRTVGGRAFKGFSKGAEPEYNNNIYLQIVLKGLGSVATSDPNYTLQTYIPGYNDPFH